jgi:hypothetical protein
VERWPPERFYWCVLDVPGPRRPGPLAPGLLEDAAALIPAPMEGLHAVHADLGGGRSAVCAAPREAVAAAAEGSSSLGPAGVPDFLAGLDPESIDLLCGEMEPAGRRRARAARRTAAAAALLALCLLTALGLARRAARWQGDQAAADRALLALAGPAALGPAGGAAPMRAELERLRRTAAAAARVSPPADAALALQEVLLAWPASASAAPQGLTVTGKEATMSVVVEGDPAAFLAALRPPRAGRSTSPGSTARGPSPG